VGAILLAASATSLYIGVDGGGTRSRARLRDADGRLLGEGDAGPGNARLGAAAFAEVLSACRKALAVAGLGEGDFGRIHAGLGLAGTAQAADRAYILGQPHSFASMSVETDAYTAWLGAHQGRDGAILIVGTGSCGLAVVGTKRFNVGGWGADISDEGSGMAIGREALRRSLWALEGMAPLTSLAGQVLDKFGRNPEAMVEWAARARPGDYAEFAPLVLRSASVGDPLARQILDPAVSDIVRMIARLTAIGAPAITLVGGLAAPIVEFLPAAAQVRLVPPIADAMDGAILMARQATQGTPAMAARL
jgi:glucosamine kinase